MEAGSAQVDAWGVPVSVRHAPQTALGVWQFVHQLQEPIEDPRRPGSPFTHVCVLCSAELLRENAADDTAWAKALMRQRMSTNAQKHMERRHPGVQFETRAQRTVKRAKAKAKTADATANGAAEVVEKVEVKKARKTLKKKDVMGLSAFELAGLSPAGVAATSIPVVHTPPTRETSRSRSTPEQIHFLLHRWLISSGRRYEETSNDELQRLLTVASQIPGLQPSAALAFSTHLKMEFGQFAQGIEQYFAREREAACDEPFLSVTCSTRTVDAGSDVWGLSASLIDSKWRHVELPLACQPLPITASNFRSPTSQVIQDTLKDMYNIDIDLLQKSSSSNDGSAPPFIKTGQKDDLIHAVSASLLRALGIAGPIQYNAESYSIRWLEQSLDRLLTFFQEPTRRGKLYQIGEFFHGSSAQLGEINTNTRLGYLYELFNRSCINYATYSRFFGTRTTNASIIMGVDASTGDEEGERIWAELSACDAWQTISEIEAMLNQLTVQLELDTRHPSRVSSSYTHFFRRLLSVTLNAKNYKCISLEDLSSQSCSSRDGDPVARESHSAELLTPTTRGFLARFREEVTARFQAAPDVNEVKAMLLDPRIKSKAESLVDYEMVAQAKEELRNEHHAVFMALADREFAANENGLSADVPPSQTSADNNESEDDSEEDEMSALLAMDGPNNRSTPTKNPLGFGSHTSDDGSTAARAKALAIRTVELEQAERKAWDRWQSLSVEWENFASSDNIYLKNGQYNVAKLYQRVDLLSWFRSVGEQLHPSMAVLARAYLARPAVTSAAHDEFVASLRDWDVVGLYKSGDITHESHLRLLERNWKQWKELIAEGVFGTRRSSSKRSASALI